MKRERRDQGITTRIKSLDERFARDLDRVFGAGPTPKLGLKTPDGEALKIDEESLTALLKRTGGE